MVPPTRSRLGKRLNEFHEAQEEHAGEFKSVFGSFLPYTFPVILAIVVFVGGALLSLGTAFYAAATVLIAGVGLMIVWRRRKGTP